MTLVCWTWGLDKRVNVCRQHENDAKKRLNCTFNKRPIGIRHLRNALQARSYVLPFVRKTCHLLNSFHLWSFMPSRTAIISVQENLQSPESCFSSKGFLHGDGGRRRHRVKMMTWRCCPGWDHILTPEFLHMWSRLWGFRWRDRGGMRRDIKEKDRVQK